MLLRGLIELEIFVFTSIEDYFDELLNTLGQLLIKMIAELFITL